MRYDLTIAWGFNNEKDTYRYDSLEQAEKGEETYIDIYGDYIRWTAICKVKEVTQ